MHESIQHSTPPRKWAELQIQRRKKKVSSIFLSFKEAENNVGKSMVLTSRGRQAGPVDFFLVHAAEGYTKND